MSNQALAAIRTRILTLPPFWTAFAFVCLVGLPQAFLALPIAAAPFGPLLGVAIVGIFGLFSTLTVAAVAGATLPRSDTNVAPMLLPGRVRDVLGGPAAFLVTGAQAITFFLALVASALGLSLTLEDETGKAPTFWLVLLAVGTLTIVTRSALGLGVLVFLGVLNVAVIFLLAFAVGTDDRAKHLSGPDGGIGGPDADDWAMMVGVSLISLFGHALVGQAARLIVARDRDGRTLVRGSAAGMLALTALLCMWVLIVDSDLWPGDLTGQRGTVLVTLERVHGDWVTALGTLLVITLPGLTTLRCATVLNGLVREHLPVVPANRSKARGFARPGRWLAANSFSLVGFLLVGMMLFTGAGSFTSILEVAGVLGVATFAGVIPPILLIAVRKTRRGPESRLSRLLGSQLVGLTVSGFFLVTMVLQPAVLWSNREERMAGFVVSVTVAIVVGAAVRQLVRRELVTTSPITGGFSTADAQPE